MRVRFWTLAALLLIVGATTFGCSDRNSISEADTGPCIPNCAVGECGQDGCGGYCEPCGIPMFLEAPCAGTGILSTFCEEETRRCRPVEAACAEGWCLVPAGSFILGPKGGFRMDADPHYPSPRPVYEQPAVLTRSFWISQTEVTQRQWLDVMETDQNPSPFAACGLDCPVSGITLFDMLEFSNRLSQKNGLEPCYQLVGCIVWGTTDGLECEKALFAGPDCEGYRLPTEAELELAIGAAADSLRGDTNFWVSCPEVEWDNRAWYMMNSEVDYPGCVMVYFSADPGDPSSTEIMRCLGPHPVGRKNANRLGLYDGLGNVSEVTGTVELTWDDPTSRDDERHKLVDPGFHDVLLGTAGGVESLAVVAKGGGFRSEHLSYARTDRFTYMHNGVSQRGAGFRLVRTARD